MPCNCPLPSTNPATNYEQLLVSSSEVLPTVYTNDDIFTVLPASVGFIDASSVVECALINSFGALVTSWLSQVDLANGNNFSQGVIRLLIPSTALTLLPIGRYLIMLRTTTATVTQTFKTYKMVVLATL